MKTSRRDFIKSAATVTAAFSGLSRYASAQAAGGAAAKPLPSKYGPLVSDPKRIFDLPAGFKYKIIGRAGDYMDDGLRIPGRADGMGTFEGADGKTILVRNHELEVDLTFEGPFGLENELFKKIESAKVYDPGKGMRRTLAARRRSSTIPKRRRSRSSS